MPASFENALDFATAAIFTALFCLGLDAVVRGLMISGAIS